MFEIALVLIIMGLIGYQIIPALATYRKINALKLTQSRRDIIMQALANFVLQYKRLPCASSTMSGTENNGCGGDVSSVAGIVPFKTLSLDAEHIVDGYGNPFTYVVNCSLTKPFKLLKAKVENEGLTIAAHNYFCGANVGIGLEITDEHDQSLCSRENAQAVILISHGPLGGSFNRTGGKVKLNTQASAKIINASHGGKYVKPSTPLFEFDDQIYFFTRDQLMLQFGHYSCQS